ncbi:transposable element Tcb2 transposase [Trichonephila clavipes]|nr:transposable element Tcb2 transposase [Trichonephila clavipes]
MCLVVLFSDFGINTNPKILCPEDLFQADHELQHLEDRFPTARRRRTTTCRSSLHTTFKHQEEESPLLRASTDLREQRTRYHQSNTVERHSYRGGGILVWAGISLGGHTDLHVFHGGTVTGLRYRDEILDPYVRPYAAAIGNDFILMDDNARPHRARIVEESGGSRFGTNGIASSIFRPESDRTSLGLSWQRVAALNPPPRSLHELKQGLLCVWSSLPIPVSDNLINSMGNRCRQCIQVNNSLLEPIFVLFLCHFTT